MQNDKLRTASIAVITEYMGIAAEFVVDDALAEVDKNQAFAKDENLRNMYFFVCLGKLLPPEAPYSMVKEAIVKATGIKA